MWTWMEGVQETLGRGKRRHPLVWTVSEWCWTDLGLVSTYICFYSMIAWKKYSFSRKHTLNFKNWPFSFFLPPSPPLNPNFVMPGIDLVYCRQAKLPTTNLSNSDLKVSQWYVADSLQMVDRNTEPQLLFSHMIMKETTYATVYCVAKLCYLVS